MEYLEHAKTLCDNLNIRSIINSMNLHTYVGNDKNKNTHSTITTEEFEVIEQAIVNIVAFKLSRMEHLNHFEKKHRKIDKVFITQLLKMIKIY